MYYHHRYIWLTIGYLQYKGALQLAACLYLYL